MRTLGKQRLQPDFGGKMKNSLKTRSLSVLIVLFAALLACSFPVTFLLALRLVGYRLEVSKPWQEKIQPAEPKPHPLDD